MSKTAKMTTCLLAALLLPAVFHCRLEAAFGWEWLQCAPHAENKTHAEPHCGGDGCAELESGAWMSAVRLFLPEPPAGPCMDQPQTGLDPVEDVFPFSETAPPPERIAGWCFLLRAAAPARAPSIAS